MSTDEAEGPKGPIAPKSSHFEQVGRNVHALQTPGPSR